MVEPELAGVSALATASRRVVFPVSDGSERLSTVKVAASARPLPTSRLAPSATPAPAASRRPRDSIAASIAPRSRLFLRLRCLALISTLLGARAFSEPPGVGSTLCPCHLAVNRESRWIRGASLLLPVPTERRAPRSPGALLRMGAAREFGRPLGGGRLLLCLGRLSVLGRGLLARRLRLG